MKRWIFIVLVVAVLAATSIVFGGMDRLDLRMGMGRGSYGSGAAGHYLLVDNATHYILIDGANHKMKISE